MNTLNISNNSAGNGALESRFAYRVAARLSEHAQDIGPDVSERLRIARDQALERARQVRLAQAASSRSSVTAAGVAILGGGWWVKLGAVVPIVALLVGLVWIQQSHLDEQISTAAEIDSALSRRRRAANGVQRSRVRGVPEDPAQLSPSTMPPFGLSPLYTRHFTRWIRVDCGGRARGHGVDVGAPRIGAQVQFQPQKSAPGAAEQGVRWQQLSPTQRTALKPLERDWGGISQNQKQKWLEVAQRFPSLQPDEQSRIQGRMANGPG